MVVTLDDIQRPDATGKPELMANKLPAESLINMSFAVETAPAGAGAGAVAHVDRHNTGRDGTIAACSVFAGRGDVALV